MSGHRPWSEIREKLRADPARRARIERREQAIAEGLIRNQLRGVHNASQENAVDPGPSRTRKDA